MSDIKLYHTLKEKPIIEYKCIDDICTLKTFTDDELKYYILDYHVLYNGGFFRYTSNLEENCKYEDNKLTINIKPFKENIDLLKDNIFDVFVSDGHIIYYVSEHNEYIINSLNNDKDMITLNNIHLYNESVFLIKLNILKSISHNMVPSYMPKLVCVKSEDYRDEIKNADLKPSAFNDEDEYIDCVKYLVSIIYDELEKYEIISKVEDDEEQDNKKEDNQEQEKDK